jgi:hypothetical protein
MQLHSASSCLGAMRLIEPSCSCSTSISRPVWPLRSVYLGYHDWQQVAVGAVVGCVVALIWFTATQRSARSGFLAAVAALFPRFLVQSSQR